MSPITDPQLAVYKCRKCGISLVVTKKDTIQSTQNQAKLRGWEKVGRLWYCSEHAR